MNYCPSNWNPADDDAEDGDTSPDNSPEDIDPAAFEDVDIPPLCAHCGEPNNNGCHLCHACGLLLCRHGNTPGDCGECDHEGDLAYDAARESRIR